MPQYRRHVFVCVNERSTTHSRGCCKAKDGVAVRAQLKKELARRGLTSYIRANASGCLDQCEQGVAVVVYPEQVWYRGVTVDDVDTLVSEHLIGGRYVTRLLMPNQPQIPSSHRGAPLFANDESVAESVAADVNLSSPLPEFSAPAVKVTPDDEPMSS